MGVTKWATQACTIPMPDCNELRPIYSCVDLLMKMRASCMFYVLLASYRLCMVVQILSSTQAILPTH